MKGKTELKENDVNINLVSTQSDGENLERTELFTRGKYKKTADGYVISYEESEATGFEGSITSLEVFGQKKVVLERTGSTESQFIIEKEPNALLFKPLMVIYLLPLTTVFLH